MSIRPFVYFSAYNCVIAIRRGLMKFYFWFFTDICHILVLVQIPQKADTFHEHLLCVHLCDWSL